MDEQLLTVLIAEGAPDFRATLREALLSAREPRYSVIEAETGERALELRSEFRPDCIIFSEGLPDMSVVEAINQLTTDNELLDYAIVVLVNTGAARLAVEAMKSGADDCIEKDRAKGEELRHAVSYAIEKVGKRQANPQARERANAQAREKKEVNRALGAGAALARGDAIQNPGIEARQRPEVGAGVGTARDSTPVKTSQKPAEEQLRLLKTAIEQSNESVIITTAELDRPGPQIVYVNPAFTKMTGYAPEEIIGKTPRILQGPKTDRAVIERLRKDLEEGRVFFGETVNYRKDGSEFYLEWSIGPVRNERGEVTHFIATQRDVSERRRVEEELRRSEEEFRSLFDLSAIGMAQVSPDGKYLHVNRKLCQMLGYSEQEMLQLTLHEVTHPEDREFSAELLSSSFSNGPDEFSIEKRYTRKDGSIIWVLINWEAIPVVKGQPMHTVANVQDITARKRAEEALRANETQLRAILDNSTAIIFVKDIEGRYLRINRWYEVMKGMTEAEIKGKTDYDLYPKEIADKVLANDREVIAFNAPIQFEEEVPLNDGLHHFISMKFPLFDDRGRLYAVCGIATDISDRKRAEEALRESEARFRQLADAMPQIVYTCDPDGELDYINQQGCQYVGAAEKATGYAWMKTVHPDDRERTWTKWMKSVADGQPCENEYRALRKDGQYRWHLARTVPVSDEEGRIVKWIGTSTDIHDRKQVEAEHDELLAREKDAREVAEAANRSKDEFLAVISHELRSPLNAMLGYARLLRYGPLDAQKIKQSVEIIERNGKAQTKLIDDLLDTARIISGKLKLDVGPVDLAEVIRDAVQTIYPAADAKGVSIKADLEPEVGQITGDPVRLQQVVWNLLTNAVKFTSSGNHVEVRLKRIDPHVCITVSDNGKGISPDFLPYVFDRFRQGDASSVRRYGGLGLGLALVKYLVELHGGTIEALSAGEGQGATFNVLLPVRAVTSPLGETEGAPFAVTGFEETTMLAGVRAMVVDDETDARELVMTVLTQYGAEVIAASSAAEAFELITTAPTRERPDVMVTDLGMPDEDGFSLLQRLREWERERGLYIPAVALTAYGRVEDRVRALMAGFQTHIAKPVEPAELAVVIASLVRRPERTN